MIDSVLVIVIVVVTLILFGTERLRADVVALIMLSLLMIVGLFRPAFPTLEECLSGFSHPGTITIASMFVLGAGLTRTGVVNHLTRWIVGLAGGRPRAAIALLMLTVGLVSSVVSNTATVAVFLPITLALSRECKVPLSHTMMPLSFMAMAGGTCTIIGTSTNVVVSSYASTHGIHGIPLFAPTPVGVVFLLLALAYVTFLAPRLLPSNDDSTGLTQKYRLSNYLSTVVVRPGSPLIGQSPLETRLRERYGVDVLQIGRGVEERWFGIRDTRLQSEDRLLVRGDAHEILRLKEMGLVPAGERRFADRDLASDQTAISEALVPPGSELIGSSIREADFRRRYGVFVLALRKHGKTLTSGIADTALEAGDTLLLQGRRDALEGYADHPDFLVLREVSVPDVRRGHAIHAAVIMLLVVALSGSGLLPILPAALLGSLAMVLTGCLHVKEAHESIDWMVIFLLAGMFPLGTAIEKSGVDDLMAAGIGKVAAVMGAAAVVPVMFAGATILTSFISNAACAVLLSPIALATASHLGVSPWPLLFAIMFGSSMAFATPVGYQTNLMVYGAGGYRFMDFVRVGLPLAILFCLVGGLLIPVFWPLHP